MPLHWKRPHEENQASHEGYDDLSKEEDCVQRSDFQGSDSTVASDEDNDNGDRS